MWSSSQRSSACVDVAMILSNGKIIAQNTPSNLVKDNNAKMHILVKVSNLIKINEKIHYCKKQNQKI